MECFVCHKTFERGDFSLHQSNEEIHRGCDCKLLPGQCYEKENITKSITIVQALESRVENLLSGMNSVQKLHLNYKDDMDSVKALLKFFAYKVGGSLMIIVISVMIALYFVDSEIKPISHPKPSNLKPSNPKPPESFFHPRDLLLPDDYVLGYSNMQEPLISRYFIPFVETLPAMFYFTLSATIDDRPGLHICFYKHSDSPYPSHASVHVQLLNQKIDDNLHHVDLRFEKPDNQGSAFGGCNNLVSDGTNVQRDQFHLRILSMELDGNKNPPYMFSLCHYNSYHASRTVWESNPFYSVPDGFQFKMVVYPGGYGDGLGTDVSFYVVSSEPFTGSMIVFFDRVNKPQSLKRTLFFNGEDRLGFGKFLSHSDLDSFISHDCMFFGISKIMQKE